MAESSPGPAQPDFGLGDLFPHITLVVLLGVATLYLALRFRDDLVAWLGKNRRRRIFVEAIFPALLTGLAAVPLEAIEWHNVLFGKVSTLDGAMLWLLAADAGLTASLLVVTLVHADAAEMNQKALVAKFEADLRKERLRVSDARSMREFYRTVSDAFLKVVSRKRERLLARPESDRIGALEPETQTRALINACQAIANGLVNAAPGTHYRVRVAYFRATGKRLEPFLSDDGTSESCFAACISEPRIRKLFEFEEGKPGCLAVAASQSGTISWVADAEAANNDARVAFTYFDEATEHEELKSIVALPIAIHGTGPFDVITIDTDCPGYFHGRDPTQKAQIKYLLINLAHRLQLEKALERPMKESTT